MNRFQKIFMSLLILAVIFLTVFSQIQRGYAVKEREKAIWAQRLADENAMKAQAAMEETEKMAAMVQIEKNKTQIIKKELEACKGKK